MKFLKMASAVTVLVLSTSANAALVGRLASTPGGTDYQAYYDDVADLTWLRDPNYAYSSGYARENANDISFDTNGINVYGQMGWQAANDWAAQLVVAGVGGWRLPTALQPNDATCSQQYPLGDGTVVLYGDGCSGSEMGNLFYNVLGNTVGSLTNSGPFGNEFGYFYGGLFWSSTEFSVDSNYAWTFSMSNGGQYLDDKRSTDYYAWAVQSGDVGASVVPVPAAAWLFASGLIGLVSVARRNRK